MSVKQNTLKGEFSLKGKGLHTGKEVCATFKPAAENTGYKIVRVDLDEKTEIPALAKYIELVDRAIWMGVPVIMWKRFKKLGLKSNKQNAVIFQ